jgi:glycosyltransferase involved in cell wall biosynthesis
MKIHVYAIAWNEEVIMPYFLRYYSEFCDRIVIYDNESTDRTPEIVRACPNAEIRSWSGNEINEYRYLEIKQSCYRDSRGEADWVIVCDADEFLFHPNIVERLEFYKNTGVTLPKVTGYEIVPNCELKPEENLPYVYQSGARATNFDKRMIFNPKLDVQFAPGCHTLSNHPAGVVESSDSLTLMHFKKLNLPYYISRHTLLGTRLSQYNIQNRFAFHYLWTPEQLTNEYNQVLSSCKPIFGD